MTEKQMLSQFSSRQCFTSAIFMSIALKDVVPHLLPRCCRRNFVFVKSNEQRHRTTDRYAETKLHLLCAADEEQVIRRKFKENTNVAIKEKKLNNRYLF